MEPQLRIAVLGPVRAWQGAEEVDLGTPQQRMVLAMLVLAQGRPVSLGELVDALWGSQPPRSAVGTVRTYASRLRRALDGDGVIESAGDGYQVRVGAAVVDLDVFLESTRAADAAGKTGDVAGAAKILREGLGEWRGPALAGIPGEFAAAQRARLGELQVDAAQRALAWELDFGRHEEATGELQALLAEHPTRERLTELLMLAHCRSGRQADALAVFDSTRRLLAAELGIDPCPALRELHHRILNTDQSVYGTGESSTLACPVPTTAVLGRDEDIEQITGLLTLQNCRQLVLTGAGGIGKTRLALAAAERAGPHFRQGAAFVDLAVLADPARVPDAIAAALGFVVQGRESAHDTLVRRLADQHLLLVLDNFEQVLDAAPTITELTERAPNLYVMATSRVVLRLRGAREYRVGPLRLASSGATTTELAHSPAAELFLQRARNAHPGFELTEHNVAAVAEICRRTDAIPLALEIAAAWMRILTPRQLLDRLDDGRLEQPGVLVDVPDRQQTMTRTIEWSYNLLPSSAQDLLTRLSVLAAPFTLDTAEAIAPPAQPTQPSPLDALLNLLDHNMLTLAARPDGERAFRLLTPIKRFATQHCVAADDVFVRLKRHLLRVLNAASDQLGSQEHHMLRLDSELSDLLAVLRWLAHQRRPSGELLRAIGDVWVWLLVRGHLRRTSELWLQIEAMPREVLRTDSDRSAFSWLMVCGMINDGDFANTIALIDQVLPDVRRLEKPTRTALLLMGRAVARAYTPNSPAHADFEQALAIAREAGDVLATGYILSHYGALLCLDDDHERARAMHQEMLTIACALSDANMRAEAHYDLAVDALADSDITSAEYELSVAVRDYLQIDHLDGLTRCLGALAALALKRFRADVAVELIGTAEAAREAVGLTPWPVVTESESWTAKEAAELLRPEEYASRRHAGRAKSVSAALTQALESLAGSAVAPSGLAPDDFTAE